jgi:type I restriction enzyme S subunit
MRRVRREAMRFFTGSSGHQRVDDIFLRKLIIPLPPVDVQSRLVEVIRNKRDQAIGMEQQATAELETAKREIEAILLGGAA